MIRYALACRREHDFEGWFRSSGDFESQSAKQLLSCPICGSQEVSKAIMAPSIARTDKQRSLPAIEAPSEPANDSAPVALLSDKDRELRGMLRTMREHLIANSDNVGEQFADVARAMHNEEVERRSIYGKASAKDVAALHEEGVEFSPLPMLPDDLS